jgi:hypothetical protein
MRHLSFPVAILSLTLAACGGDEFPLPDPADEVEVELDPAAPVAAQTQDRFWTNLQALCGEAYRGRATRIEAVETDFSGELIVHFRECEPGEMRIPFHVGDDRSRTWVLTRTPEGLRLKHDHRNDDGSEAEISQYGGDTMEPGTENRQEFHADAFTAELLPEAATNVWTLEIQPGEGFVYALRREGTDRRVRFEFDLTDPVSAPPAPWGAEGTP